MVLTTTGPPEVGPVRVGELVRGGKSPDRNRRDSGVLTPAPKTDLDPRVDPGTPSGLETVQRIHTDPHLDADGARRRSPRLRTGPRVPGPGCHGPPWVGTIDGRTLREKTENTTRERPG